MQDVRAGADEVAPEEVDAEECQCYASVYLEEVEYVAPPQIVVLPNEGETFSCFEQYPGDPRRKGRPRSEILVPRGETNSFAREYGGQEMSKRRSGVLQPRRR